MTWRRMLLGVLVIGGCLPGVQAQAATEVVITPQAFATDAAYCGDGFVDVAGRLTVTSGPGTFTTGGCQLDLAPKARITFLDVQLDGSGVFNVDSGEKARLTFDGSTLTMGDSISLTPGDCCTEPGGKTRVTVVDSQLVSSTDTVSLNASGFDVGGRTTVIGSTLDAGGGPGDEVVVAASHNPDGKGTVFIDDSTLDAAGDRFQVITAGKTTVQNSNLVFTTTALITAKPGGKCKSANNTPDVPCT